MYKFYRLFVDIHMLFINWWQICYDIWFDIVIFSLRNVVSFWILNLFYRKSAYEEKIQYTISEKKDKKSSKAHVNSVFFKQLRQLLRKLKLPNTGYKEKPLTLTILVLPCSHTYTPILECWDGSTDADCCHTDRTICQRYLDDTECDSCGEYHYTYESGKVQDGATQISCCLASGKSLSREINNTIYTIYKLYINLLYNLFYLFSNYQLDFCGYQRLEMESGWAEAAFPHESDASSVQSVP